MKRGVFFPALVLLPLAVAAQAQPPRESPADTDPSIVVTGTRLTREQARERAVEFVRQVGVARGQQAAARWIDPVCPRVAGIAEPYAGIVVARMRAIAEQAGMRIGRENCDPNISVSFVGDAEELMREIDRRSSARLREVPVEARRALVDGDAPIRWWYLTGERSRHGMGSTSQSLPMEGDPSVQPVQVEAISHYDSSVISTQVNRAIVHASVVIDLDRVEGRRLDAIAAYAAFVAFAEVRASDPPPPGSILGMFGPEPDTRSLTDWDTAFLRALYRLPLDRPARRHRGILVRDMVNAQTPG